MSRAIPRDRQLVSSLQIVVREHIEIGGESLFRHVFARVRADLDASQEP